MFVSICLHLFYIIQLSRRAVSVWKYASSERPRIFVTFWSIPITTNFHKRYDLSLPLRFPSVKIFPTGLASDCFSEIRS